MSSNFYKDKDPYEFIRYGSLKSKKQKGYGEDGFHAPPARRGIYAMSKPFQELFLVSCLYETQPGLYTENQFWDKKKRRERFRKTKKFFRKDRGFIWSHLENVPNHLVFGRHNSWVKTELKVWRKYLNKRIMKMLNEKIEHWEGPMILGYKSKDEFEVFFEKI